MEALKRSSFASASSRSASRTFTLAEPLTSAARSRFRVHPPGGTGSTPRPGRAGGTRHPRCARAFDRRLERVRRLDTGLAAEGVRDRDSRALGPGRKTTTTGRSGRSRSCLATAAAMSEDLPTPLGPYNTVSLEAITLADTISMSRSRPKNSIASIGVSANGARPLYGEAGRGSLKRSPCRRGSRRPGQRRRSRRVRRPGRRGGAKRRARASTEPPERPRNIRRADSAAGGG